MALLTAQDEQVLTTHLSAIEKPVTVLVFTQTIGGSESGAVTMQVLSEVARLNDKITVEEKNFILDVEDRCPDLAGVIEEPIARRRVGGDVSTLGGDVPR